MKTPGKKRQTTNQMVESKEEQRSFLPGSKNGSRCSSLGNNSQTAYASDEEAMDYLASLLVKSVIWQKQNGKSKWSKTE